MKVCDNCQRLNPEDAEVCIGCGESDFEELLFPFYNDIKPYLEDKEEE